MISVHFVPQVHCIFVSSIRVLLCFVLICLPPFLSALSYLLCWCALCLLQNSPRHQWGEEEPNSQTVRWIPTASHHGQKKGPVVSETAKQGWRKGFRVGFASLAACSSFIKGFLINCCFILCFNSCVLSNLQGVSKARYDLPRVAFVTLYHHSYSFLTGGSGNPWWVFLEWWM